ncbi:conjugative transfer TraG domain protein [Orientia tsutsugamushi str. TA763]|nr:conjugative transfer TraG domain protein [Orientia tsutsugamushi str. TA763]
MDYVIYTFGGGDLLWHVFNGIGRVFASNSEYFTPVGHLALTIGGIWLLLGLFLEEISASLLWSEVFAI